MSDNSLPRSSRLKSKNSVRPTTSRDSNHVPSPSFPSPRGSGRPSISHNRSSISKSKYLSQGVSSRIPAKHEQFCTRKGHEKGRIQYVCIEQECHNDKRLGCANCILFDHENHVQSKVTIDQFYSMFDRQSCVVSEKVNLLQEIEKELFLPQFKQKIKSDLDQIQMMFTKFIEQLKLDLFEEIQENCLHQNQMLIQKLTKMKASLYKLQEAGNKSVFEMTPAEFRDSVSLFDQGFNIQLKQQVQQMQEDVINNYQKLSTRWIELKNKFISDLNVAFEFSKNSFFQDDEDRQPQRSHSFLVANIVNKGKENMNSTFSREITQSDQPRYYTLTQERTQ